MKRILKFNILLLILICFAVSAYAATLTINGTTYNASGSNMSGVNVTVETYLGFDTFVDRNSTLSNDSGHYQVNITDASNYMYKLILKHYNDTNASKITVDFIGASLPPFPHSEFTNMLNLSAVNFYLKEAVTININATNSSGDGPVNFTYQIKDKALGYPIKSDWQTKVFNLTAHLPANRSYSIMIYPQNSMPISYDLNNISKYSAPRNISITFDTSEKKKWVSGCINATDNVNLTKVDVIAYLIEPGSMVFFGQAMPHNMSAWRTPPAPDEWYSDNFTINNASIGICNGFYNMTLIGAAMGVDVMLIAVAKTNNSDEYYGALKNISLTNNSNDVTDFNFILKKLPGTPTDIRLEHMRGGNTSTYYNVTVPQVNFALINSNNESLDTATGHIEVELDYSAYYTEGPVFTWMTDLTASDSGVFTLPLLNNSIKKLNFFTQNYAPVKKTFTQQQVDAGNINITLKEFNPGGIDATDNMTDIFIAIYKSSAECDVPTPPTSCILAKDDTEDNFKPLNAVVSGGKISFRMRKNSNNITVHYKNVDLLASGPPDVAFDSSATQNQSGSALEAAWRFGSQGPEIYESILIGIPYNEADVDESAPISILIGNLYDQDWNKIWNSTANPDGANYSAVANADYSGFNQNWFNSTINGMPCSTSNITANCFVNTTTNTIWLQIPHFSGIGPTVKSTTVGGVTMKVNTSRINCVDICTIDMNITNSNYTISSSLRNIILNITETIGNIRGFKIYKRNISSPTNNWPLNGTNATLHNNYNITLSNGSQETIHQYRIEVNKTNRTDTIMNISYNISGLTDALNLEITLDGTPPTATVTHTSVSATEETLTATTNENSTCRISTTSQNYTQMSSAMTPDAAGTSHTNTSSGLSASTSYTFYASCEDIAGNEMNSSSSTTFTTSAASTTSTGGGGGGGSTSSETSVAKKWSMFMTGRNTMTISKDGIAFTELVMTSTKPKSDVEITVEKLSSKPSSTTAFSDTNYQYLEVTKENINDTELSKAEITFKVEKSWLTEKSISEANVKLYRYSSDKWNALVTTKTSSDSTYTYYKATSPGLSYFAIGGKKTSAAGTANEVTTEETEGEAPTTAGAAEESEEKETAAKKSKPWLIWLIIAIVVIALLAIFFVYLRKQEEKLS